MKKVFAVLLLLLVSHPLYATQSRLSGLGLENWMIEEDDNLIWFNPQRIIDYPKILWGELGTASGSGITPTVDNNITIADRWAGASGYCPVVDGAVIGVFLNRLYPGFAGNAGFNAAGSDVTAPTVNVFGNSMSALQPNTRFEAFYALPNPIIKDKVNVGLRLSYAGNFEKNDDTTQLTPSSGSVTASDELNSSDLVIAIGGKMKDIYIITDLDVVLSIGMPSVKNNYNSTYNTGAAWINADSQSLDLSSKLNLGFAARARIPLRNWPLFGYFNYSSEDASNSLKRTTDIDLNGTMSPAEGDLSYTQERVQSRKALSLGASYNIKTSPRTLTIIAASLQQASLINKAQTSSTLAGQSGISEEYNYEASSLAIPVHFAVEHTLSSVVTTRLGAVQNIYQITTTTISDPDYTWNAASSRYQQTGLVSSTNKSQNQGGTIISLGAGIRIFNGFTLDTLVRQEILFSGTYLVSGVPETIVSRISALYKF